MSNETSDEGRHRLEVVKHQLEIATEALTVATDALSQLEARQPPVRSGDICPTESASVTCAPSARLIPVPEWSKYHPWPTKGGLRHLILHRATNGFEQVIRRVGDRVLIHEPSFFDWVEQQRSGSSPAASAPCKGAKAPSRRKSAARSLARSR